MAKVSVLLTSYNHARFVGESIESILKQTFTEFELIIIDDCSTDNSWEIIESYNDPRIRAIRMESNTNCAYFDTAIQKLQGQYIAIAHCDDKWREDKLEKQVAYLDAHPDVDACFTNVSVIDEEGKEVLKDDIYVEAFNRDNNSRYEWLRSLFYDGCGLCHPSLLIRKEACETFELFSVGLSSIPDYRKWIRLCALGDIYVIKEKLTYFRSRKNGGNTSGDRPEIHYRNVTELFFVLREFLLIKNPIDFVKVFPYANKYLVNGEMVIPFAYARVLIDTIDSPPYNLLGLQLIYELFQKPEEQKKLEKLYGYRVQDYSRETVKYDVFKIIPKESFMSVRVYADVGCGFTLEDSILYTDIYINSHHQFTLNFDLNKISKGKKVRTIKIDIGQGDYRKFADVQVTCEKEVCELKGSTPYIEKEGWQMFCTPFVHYSFDVAGKEGKYTCTGRTDILSNWEVEAIVNSPETPEEMLMDAFYWYRRLKTERSRNIVKKTVDKIVKKPGANINKQ